VPALGHADRQVAQVPGQRAGQGQRRQHRRWQGEAGGLFEAAERGVRGGGPGAGVDTSQSVELPVRSCTSLTCIGGYLRRLNDTYILFFVEKTILIFLLQ
jgi:hypothetical protein